MTLSDLHVTLLLVECGTATMGALAKKCNVSAAAMTAIADRLAGADMLERCRDASDRRQVFLSATSKAKELMQEAHAAV